MKVPIKTMIFALLLLLISLSLENCASRVVYVRKEPPTRLVEVKPAKPFGNAVWISGYWNWNGKNYTWISGRWVKPRKGKVWVGGHWQNTRRGWHYIPGHWK